MAIFITVDGSNNILEVFDDTGSIPVPAGAIEITQDDLNLINQQRCGHAACIYNGNTVEVSQTKTDNFDINRLKSVAKNKIIEKEIRAIAERAKTAEINALDGMTKAELEALIKTL